MLRVSYSETRAGQRWVLCGRLAGPWVDELRSCWFRARERTPDAHAVVDLKDVTFIDAAGEKLLAEMMVASTEFLAAGVQNNHLLAALKERQVHSVPNRAEDPGARQSETVTTQRGER